VDVTGFEGMTAVEATPMRDDVPGPAVDRRAVAANAPSFSGDGHFIVPKVIGD
jgi:Asp-tRNA(Asn)/Glu-tRNA(Gln) amidotransferase C subunit